MKEIMIKPSETVEICLGIEGEHGARAIVFDLTEWRSLYGVGKMELLVIPRKGEPYPAFLEQAETEARWIVSSSDTAQAGKGKIQLMYVVDNTIAKSAEMDTVIYKSTIETGKVPPPAHQGWVDHIVQVGENARESADRASRAAGRSEFAAGEAEESAAAAAGSETAANQSRIETSKLKEAVDLAKQEIDLAAEQVRQDSISAGNSAQSASDSARTAETAASNAEKFAGTAATKATEAGKSATAANNAAESATNAVGGFDRKVQESTTAIQTAGSEEVEKVKQEGTAQKTILDEEVAQFTADRQLIHENKENIQQKVASAFVEHVSGTVIAVDDVSPIQHVMDVKVESANVIGFEYEDSFGTRDGITSELMPDKSIHFFGTATKLYEFHIKSIDKSYISIPLSDYTISGCPENGEIKKFNLLGMFANKSGTNYFPRDLGNGATVGTNVESIKYLNFYIYPEAGAVDFIVKPMLNKGTTVLPYAPYVPDVSQSHITIKSTEADTGTTYSVNPDGTVTAPLSISPNMTILSDTEGLLINTTYNQDGKIWMRKLLSEIVSGGVSNNLSILNNHKDIQKLKTIAEATGNPVCLRDSAEELLKGLEISGSTTQVQTSGKNLFQLEAPQTISGVSIKKVNDYYVLNGTATLSNNFVFKIGELEEGMYVLSANNKNHNNLSTAIVQIYSPSTGINLTCPDNQINSIAKGKAKKANDYETRVRIEYGVKYDNYIIKPQLELGSEPTPYEPFTGGEPSPSPNYPQEVKNGSLSEISDTGKNLVNLADFEDLFPRTGIRIENDSIVQNKGSVYGLAINNPTFLQIGKTYNFSCKISETTPNNPNRWRIIYEDNENEIPRGLETSIKIKKKIKQLVIYSMWGYESKNDVVYSDIIITPSTATSYEPFKGQTLKLSKPIELSKWDRIKKIDGLWKKENNTATIVFDGSEDEIWYRTTNKDKSYYRMHIKPSPLPKTNPSTERIGEIYCEEIIRNTNTKMYDFNQDGITIGKDGTIYIYCSNGGSTVEDWKKYLSLNPIKVSYCLETPTYEILPQPDQDLLNKITTFYPNSVIQTDEGISLNLKYIADNKLYNDRTNQILLDRIEQIEQAILQI